MNDVLPNRRPSEEILARREAVKLMGVDELYAQYHRLIFRMVNNLIRPEMQEYDDCVQEAFFGLFKAQEKYDPEKSEFTTYLKFWVYAYVNNFLSRERSLFRRNSRTGDLSRRIQHARSEAQARGIELSDLDLSKEIEVPLEKIQDFRLRDNAHLVPITSTGANEECQAGYMNLSGEGRDVDEEAISNLDAVKISALLNSDLLTDREKFILRKAFLEKIKNPAIGEMIGVSRERVRQIMKKALQKLRNHFASNINAVVGPVK